jgi:hypothetical protein
MRFTAVLVFILAMIALPVLAQYPAEGYTGKVIETMDSGKYTYVLVDTGKEQVWGAAPQFKIEVGEEVVVPTGMPMPQFKSKTLDRTFDMLFFASAIPRVGEVDPAELVPHEHPNTSGGMSASEHPSGGMSAMGGQGHTKVEQEAGIREIKPAEQTVGELFEKRADFAGKKILLRGQVVKVLNGIMGTNWLHLQDGTGEAGTNDLTVTTSATVNKGDVVLISGTLSLDKDFGMGYFYELIVENASVMVE